jgi:hypothetical protein
VLGGDASGNGLKGGGGSFLVRIETFPLISLGGPLRDAGLALSFGTGGLSLVRGGEKVVEAGGTSAIGVSAFHECLRFWHLAMGPQLDYEHQFADSVSAHRLVLGWRTAFYAGP